MGIAVTKTRKCKYCDQNAIIRLAYANLNLCKKHFIEFYEKRIKKMIEKYKIKGEVMVAVSGGKDSMALLHALNKISNEAGIDVIAYHIDLGIGKYSEESKKIVLEFAKRIGVLLIVSDIKNDLGFTIPEIIKYSNKPPCAVCGIVKRWLINRVAYDLGIKYVATGHNIDDVSTMYLKALLTQDIYSLSRGQYEHMDPMPEIKMVGRIRPQFYLSERENRLYTILNDIPVVDIECPLGKRAVIHKYKVAWDTLLRINPVGQINLTKTMIKITKNLRETERELRQCSRCGFPTESDRLCAFCRLVSRFKSWKKE